MVQRGAVALWALVAVVLLMLLPPALCTKPDTGVLIMYGGFKPPHFAHFALADSFLENCVDWQAMKQVHVWVFMTPGERGGEKSQLAINNKMAAVVWRHLYLPVLQKKFPKVVGFSFFMDEENNYIGSNGRANSSVSSRYFDVHELAPLMGLGSDLVTGRHVGEYASAAQSEVERGTAVFCSADQKWPKFPAVVTSHALGVKNEYSATNFRKNLKAARSREELLPVVFESLPWGTDLWKATEFWEAYIRNPNDFSWLPRDQPVPNIRDPWAMREQLLMKHREDRANGDEIARLRREALEAAAAKKKQRQELEDLEEKIHQQREQRLAAQREAARKEMMLGVYAQGEDREAQLARNRVAVQISLKPTALEQEAALRKARADERALALQQQQQQQRVEVGGRQKPQVVDPLLVPKKLSAKPHQAVGDRDVVFTNV